MKKIIVSEILLFLLIIFLIYSCDEAGVNNPVIPTLGVNGKVLDITGKPISNVSVHYLFNYNYVPHYSPPLTNATSSVDSFGFNFYQNFPNPVSDSLFFRFSIAEDMDIELTFTDLASGVTVYTIAGFYVYGFYQHYFDHFVSSNNLVNSCYLVKFRALKNGIPKYEASKKLTILSVLSKPNTTSNDQGIYSFEYKNASIGDTIFSTIDGNNILSLEITNKIYLLFKKEGYLPEIIQVDLYPDLLLSRDVVLRKEE